MQTSEWKWMTRDGFEIYSKAWEPEGKAKGVVCLVHGAGEHIGRYQADGEALVMGGYILAGFDLRGFGKSEGKRGHTPSLNHYYDDIDSFLDEIARRYPGMPQFLYGHSMGGILVLGYIPLRKPAITGVIVTSPGLKSAIGDQKFKVFLAKLLGTLIPEFTMNSGVDPKTLTRDDAAIEKYIHDPLVHFKVTTSWGKSMLEAIDLAYKKAPDFPLPLLLMQGAKDMLAYPSGSELYAEMAPKERLTFKMWDEWYHELHTDPEKAKVFEVMVDWMDEQLLHTVAFGEG